MPNTSKNKKSPSRATELVLIGASLAAAAASYYFLGPDGKKNQQNAKDWTVKMKDEVVKKLEMAKEISKPVYDEIIDSIATEYAGLKNVNQAEIDELVIDLKKHWESIADSAKKKA